MNLLLHQLKLLLKILNPILLLLDWQVLLLLLLHLLQL
jgi:hypothetical protein